MEVRPVDASFCIRTLEGSLLVGLDDMVIRGVKGEIYPCKRDIFDATYEPAEEGPSAERGGPSAEFKAGFERGIQEGPQRHQGVQ